MQPFIWNGDSLLILDQSKLPLEEKWIRCRDLECVARAIENLKVRGAPAIGISAGYALAISAIKSSAKDPEIFREEINKAAERLKITRPTAVNLFWAIDRILDLIYKYDDVTLLREKIVEEANKIMEEDMEANKKIGEFGYEFLKDKKSVLTHCNAGGLATSGYGTALAPIKTCWARGHRIGVFVTETRPLLQGARLTAYELKKENIPVTLITDNMVAHLMANEMLDAVLVGADRILRTGHVVNKIGTYGIAILAEKHRIPFYVAAPSSTFDLKKGVEEVIIEERDPEEVTHIGEKRIAPEGIEVFNPAFDITPPNMIDAIFTEKGVLRPPYEESILSII
ncbi:MAG: S-methyl-5-thioribose-1-phosphate isomerase [Candidatus Hydrothermarchaeota archaeon]